MNSSQSFLRRYIMYSSAMARAGSSTSPVSGNDVQNNQNGVQNNQNGVQNNQNGVQNNRYTIYESKTYTYTYHKYIHTCLLLIMMLWHRKATFLIERRQVVFLCWMQDSNPGNLRQKSPADWIPNHKPTGISRINMYVRTYVRPCMHAGIHASIHPIEIDVSMGII